MVPLPDGTTFESLTEAMCGFNIAGPKSRQILQRMTNSSLATEDFPFMRSQWIEIAGVRALAIRVSFTGDLGWELHCASEDQARLYEALLEAGAAFGAGPVGSRALMSLRVEKGYGSWSREYSPEYYPQEVGLERLCKMEKDFLHKEAVAETCQPTRERLVLCILMRPMSPRPRPMRPAASRFSRMASGLGGSRPAPMLHGRHVSGAWVRERRCARRSGRGHGSGPAAPSGDPVRAAI